MKRKSIYYTILGLAATGCGATFVLKEYYK